MRSINNVVMGSDCANDGKRSRWTAQDRILQSIYPSIRPSIHPSIGPQLKWCCRIPHETSFMLPNNVSSFYWQVIGIDVHGRCIETALKLQEGQRIEYEIEGKTHIAALNKDKRQGNITFKQVPYENIRSVLICFSIDLICVTVRIYWIAWHTCQRLFELFQTLVCSFKIHLISFWNGNVLNCEPMYGMLKLLNK